MLDLQGSGQTYSTFIISKLKVENIDCFTLLLNKSIDSTGSKFFAMTMIFKQI